MILHTCTTIQYPNTVPWKRDSRFAGDAGSKRSSVCDLIRGGHPVGTELRPMFSQSVAFSTCRYIAVWSGLVRATLS